MVDSGWNVTTSLRSDYSGPIVGRDSYYEPDGSGESVDWNFGTMAVPTDPTDLNPTDPTDPGGDTPDSGGKRHLLMSCRFTNVVSSQEPDIANPGMYINTVSMDVVRPGINNLTGLHLDLDGVGTGVGQITPLDGVTINGSTSPALIDGNNVRGDSSHVVMDTIATSGWGGQLVTLKFVNLPDSYTDGSMSPESMVSSLIREEYIQTNSNDGWVTLTSNGIFRCPVGMEIQRPQLMVETQRRQVMVR